MIDRAALQARVERERARAVLAAMNAGVELKERAGATHETPISAALEQLRRLHADDKPWWQSRGVVGSLVAVIAGVAGLLGATVDVVETEEVVIAAFALIGGGIALIGRIRARRPIRFGAKPTGSPGA